MKVCAVIPTYNNATTLEQVVDGVARYISDIIVVDDGSTDATASLLQKMGSKVAVISYKPNKGKGFALQAGLDYARRLGFTHAVTIDSDGQHYPEDIPSLLALSVKNPTDIILGARGTKHSNMSSKSTFANRFSNFWFFVQTFRAPGDTQTGFRVYPLKKRLRFFTNRYEAELAVLVNACWNGYDLKSVPIKVYYPPKEERVSHFRPFTDFARISVLNTCLCFIAVVYGYPSMIIHRIARCFALKE